jgi:hypothetical protein
MPASDQTKSPTRLSRQKIVGQKIVACGTRWSEFAKKPSRRSIVQEEKSMSEQPLDGSRRALMHVVGSAISAALVFRMPQANASDKMTRQQAQYQDTPSGIYSCGLCTLFERPNACKVVEGEVSRDGWCRAFALAD